MVLYDDEILFLSEMVSFFSNGGEWEDREKTDCKQKDFQNARKMRINFKVIINEITFLSLNILQLNLYLHSGEK